MRRLLIALLTCILASSVAHAFVGPRRTLLSANKVNTAWVLPGAVGQVNMINSPATFSDSASWQYINISDTTFATKIRAPDGTITGSKWIANTTNSTHGLQSKNAPGIVKVARAMDYKLVCFAKAGEYSRITLNIQNLAGSSGVVATFDLLGGQVLAGGVGGAITFGSGYTGIGTEVVSAGNGWWRIGMTFTSDAAGAFMQSHNIDNGVGQAARSFSFAGNNANGMYVWMCNLLPAGAWNHKNLIFEDKFTSISTVDLSNTKAIGFKWYLGGPWPNSTNYTNITQTWRIVNQQVSGCCSITADGLSISELVGANEAGLGLSTTASTGGSSYVGWTYSAGGLYCASMKFNPASMASGQPMWPSAGWGISQEFLTGSASDFIELDNYEAIPTGTGTYSHNMSTFEWLISALVLSNNHRFYNPSLANNDNTPHRYCTLWTTAAENGGVGYRQRYFDNTYLGAGDITYSSGAGANPAFTSNPNGTFFVAESQNFPIILSSWQGIASFYQYVRLWQ